MTTRVQSVDWIDSKAALKGEEILRELVELYSAFIYRLAYVILRNHHDAEDVVQETFLRVSSHKEDLLDVQNMRAWLGKIAWRIAQNRRRNRSKRPGGLELELLRLRFRGAGPEQLASSRQMLKMVGDLVAALPTELRDALELSVLDELTSGEVSQILGIPEATVRTRVFRARKLLRDKLENLLGETSHGE